MKFIIEEWDGDGAIRIPDEALQELELDVGDAVYLIEEFVGNTRCLVLSKKPQIADRIDELTEAWDNGQLGHAKGHMRSRAYLPADKVVFPSELALLIIRKAQPMAAAFEEQALDQLTKAARRALAQGVEPRRGNQGNAAVGDGA